MKNIKDYTPAEIAKIRTLSNLQKGQKMLLDMCLATNRHLEENRKIAMRQLVDVGDLLFKKQFELTRPALVPMIVEMIEENKTVFAWVNDL